MSLYTPQNLTPASPRNSAKEPVSTSYKHPIIDDMIAFLSIIAAYKFMSLTYTYNFFEILFLLKMDNFAEIKSFLAIYVISVLVLKGFAKLMEYAKPSHQRNVFQVLSESINRSIIIFIVIVALFIIAIRTGAKITVSILSHMSLWLLIAETNFIFGSVGNHLFNLESLNIFGYALEGLLIVMAGMLTAGFDAFDFL